MDIFNLRQEYSSRELDIKDVDKEPIEQFKKWFHEALYCGIQEVNAMSLATISNNRPTSRIVLLKQIQPEGLIFFTNYESQKAQQLDENPYCALNFLWEEMERQVRIEGVASKLSPEESDSYFELRPEKSKLGAWASPQSMVIPDREYLQQLMNSFEANYTGKEIKRPHNWGGYIVKPDYFEFWQGRPSRLHDRIRYRVENYSWIIERLAP